MRSVAVALANLRKQLNRSTMVSYLGNARLARLGRPVV